MGKIKMVVYCIVNVKNNKKYVGSTVDFNRRKNRHINLLRKGCHHSLKLQRSFNKNGESSFNFLILEQITNKDELIETEQKWIDDLKPEYNMTQIAGLNSHLGLKRSKETKEKISKSLTGKKQTEKHLEANRNSHLGLKQSEETKNKRSITLKNSVIFQKIVKSKERNEKVKESRIKNGGYIVSEEQKKKISETLKAKKFHSPISKKIGKYDLDGNLIQIYPSILNAEKQNNLSQGSLKYNIRKCQKTHYKNNIWKIITT